MWVVADAAMLCLFGVRVSSCHTFLCLRWARRWALAVTHAGLWLPSLPARFATRRRAVPARGVFHASQRLFPGSGGAPIAPVVQAQPDMGEGDVNDLLSEAASGFAKQFGKGLAEACLGTWSEGLFDS